MKSFKRFIASLLTVVLLLSSAPISGFTGLEFSNIFDISASAETYGGTCGENLTWSLDSQTGELIISGIGEMYDYSHTSCPWETYREHIKSVEILNGVTNISTADFSYCENLTSVQIPNSIVTIGSSAFRHCDSLKSIVVNGDNQYYSSDSYGVLYNHNKSVLIQYPAGNENATFKIPDSVITIVNYAFDNCTNLVNIDFPNSVTTIGACAFLNCSNLTNLNISNTVSYIGEGAFCGCESITDIIIPDSVATIEASTFIRCSNLKNITLGKNVRKIGEEAFSGCKSLENVYFKGDFIEWFSIDFDIRREDFSGYLSYLCHSNPLSYADNLYADGKLINAINNTVIIPDGVKEIRHSTFYCGNFNRVILPEGVTYIGVFSFRACQLSSITIPKTVKNIDNYAFVGCDNLKDVYYMGSSEEWRKITISQENYSLNRAKIHFNHTHSYNIETIEATCEDAGLEIAVCECGDILYSKPIERLGHSFKFVSVKPTCTEVGYECNECEHCQQRNSYVEIPMVPHDLVHSKTPSTCTSRGKECECCTNCGAEFDIVYYPSEEHEWGEWTIETEPTNVADGWEKQKCLNCESYIARNIPMLGEIESVYVNDIGLNYKEFSMIVPTVDIDERVSYSVTYSSSDPSVATVDENGNIYGAGKGNATITCTVTDEFGNVVSDTCDVEVNYTFGQWLIVIFLFGWIWY